MENENEGRRIKSVENACRILEQLRRSGGATLSDLAEEVGLSPGTVHTHLATLGEQGYVRKEDETYQLDARLLPLAEHMRNHSHLYQAAKEEVDELAARTGESVHLIIEHQGRVVVLYESFGKNAVAEDYHARKRERPLQHLHCTAAGKAILAELGTERVDEIIDRHGLVEQTPNTITDERTLFDTLDSIKERNFSLCDEEQLLGIRAVGASILHADQTVAGSISLSAPKSRLRGDRFEEEIPEEVVDTASVIEVNLHTIETPP